MSKIDRYSFFVFQGEGQITDHLTCTEIIKLEFPRYDQDRAKKVAQKCVDWLNEYDEESEKV